MGRWIAELKKCENAENGHCQNRQNPDRGRFCQFCQFVIGPNQRIFRARRERLMGAVRGTRGHPGVRRRPLPRSC